MSDLEPNNTRDPIGSNAALSGNYFEEGSGASRPCLLRVAGRYAYIHDSTTGARLVEAAIEIIDVSDRIGSVARRVTFPDGAVFVTHDNNGVDLVIGDTASGKLVTWLEHFHPRLIILAFIAIGLVFGLYRYGLPVAISLAVRATPNNVITTLSQTSLETLDRFVLTPSKLSEERKALLTQGFQDLLQYTSEKTRSLQPKLLFRGGKMGPNAFALPDGSIVVTDALIKLLKDDAIIGVIGHEFGHVNYQHGMKHIYRAAGVSALILLVGGDFGGIGEEVLIQGAGFLSLAHSRDFEREADAYSVQLMKLAGRNPTSILTFFEKIKKIAPAGDKIPAWLSSHPGTNERIENIQKLSKEN